MNLTTSTTRFIMQLCKQAKVADEERRGEGWISSAISFSMNECLLRKMMHLLPVVVTTYFSCNFLIFDMEFAIFGFETCFLGFKPPSNQQYEAKNTDS